MKKVVYKNGNPIFQVDGKDIAPVAYMSYLPTLANYREFHSLGYELFGACIYLGDMPINELSGIRPFEQAIWTSREVYDFSVVDRVVQRALGDVPKGYLLLRINVNVPSWWRKENPDELVLCSDGKTWMQSSFSEKWITDVKTFFDKLKAHIEQSSYAQNVIAWQIAAMNTEEWIAPAYEGEEPDFSICARKGFAAWCKEKYTAIAALNRAWNTQYSGFSEVEIPGKEQRAKHGEKELADIREHAQTVDWYRCFNDSYASAIKRLAAYVKQIFNNDIFVGCFYGYVGQLGCYTGHCAFSGVLNSPYVDFFASPCAYTEERKTARDWFYHSAMQSCARAGKLWFLEGDIRTCQTKSLHESMPSLVEKDNARMNMRVWFGPQTEEESLWNLTRAFAKFLTSGNAYWWFDMWGGWYNTPKMLRFMRESRDVYISAMEEVIPSASEVAVVLDQDASYGMSRAYYGKTYFLQLMWLGDAGAPYDLYLKGDFLAEDLKKYKCVLYLAPLERTQKDRDILSQLEEAGITVILTGKEYGISGKNLHSVQNSLSEEELRVYYQKAGVHIYLDKTGLLYANERFVCITAAEEGEYTLTMPKDCTLYGVFDKENYRTQSRAVKIPFRKNQSKLFVVKRL